MMKILKNLVVMTVLSLFSLQMAWADTLPLPPLDQVQLTLTAQEWAKTDKAKVTVAVNAVLNKMALADMRGKIMTNLNKIAKGNWHVTNFERSQDSSGLEKLYVEAEARINETALTNVNAEAEKISGSGIKYKIQDIDFTPSVADIEKVKKSLRADIYRQTQEEITALNALYPKQAYQLHSIHFSEFIAASTVRTQVMMVSGGARPQANVESNSVSNLITLTANVNLASQPAYPATKNA
jgi:hypothetical protein